MLEVCVLNPPIFTCLLCCKPCKRFEKVLDVMYVCVFKKKTFLILSFTELSLVGLALDLVD